MLDEPTPYRWPVSGPLQMPDSSLPYAYVAHAETNNGVDPLVEVSLSIAPSGTSEVQCTSLTVEGDQITARMVGGVSGQNYTVDLVMTTSSGNVFQVQIDFPVGRVAGSPITPPAPPSTGFGTSVVWTASS